MNVVARYGSERFPKAVARMVALEAEEISAAFDEARAANGVDKPIEAIEPCQAFAAPTRAPSLRIARRL